MQTLSAPDKFYPSPSDNPYWNESVWFSITIPELRLHGFIQYYFRPNMGLLNGGPVLWDPTGHQVWNCRYYNWSQLQACPPGAEKFNMQANNSLSVEVVETMQHYRIGYDFENLKLDLHWHAIAPMHQLRSKDPGQHATQKFHMEQAGHMQGTMVLDGKEYAIDCYSMRDTSYGPRDYSFSSNGGYFWGISQHSAFHAIVKGEGPQQHVIGGFIWQDGELASLDSGYRHVERYSDLGPERVRIAMRDQLGREMTATGKLDPGFIFTGYSDHTVLWSLLEWDWDGVRHWGDNQEFCPALTFRRIARGDINPGQ